MARERDERAAITVALASAPAAAFSRGCTGTVGLERLDDVDHVDELDVAERAEAPDQRVVIRQRLAEPVEGGLAPGRRG